MMRFIPLAVALLLLSTGAALAQRGGKKNPPGQPAEAAPQPVKAVTHVLHVEGKPLRQAQQSPLAAGEVIAEGEALDLRAADARVVVWDAAHGLRHLRSPVASAGGEPRPATGTVDALATPVDRPQGRSLDRFRYPAEIGAHFQGRAYLVLGKTWLRSLGDIKPTGDSVLIVKFRNLSANYQASQRLPQTGDTVHIDPAQILQLSGRPVPATDASDFELWLYAKKSQKAERLATFRLIVGDEARIEAELRQFWGVLQGQSMTGEARKALLWAFVCAAFGEPDPQNYHPWIARHLPEAL